MSKVIVLGQKAIEEVLDMKQVIEVVEKVYFSKSTGSAIVWPMIFYEFEPGKADMDIKSGYIKENEIYGLKLVSWFSENGKKGLPLLYGTTLVFDSNTGAPIGLLNAEYITGMRTGAAGAIGAKYLAKKDSENLLMVGAGHQAIFQIVATLIVMDNIKTVRIYDAIDLEKVKSLSSSLKKNLTEKFLSKYEKGTKLYDSIAKKFDVNVEVVTDIKEAVEKSEIIITATPSRKPMIMKEWVKEGTHFSCVGSDIEGKQEIDENIFRSARVYVDDIAQAIKVGEVEIPIKKEIIEKKDIIAEIGEVIAGHAPGRNSDDDITIYDTTGIALQDLMTSKLALDLAKEKGFGLEVDL